MMQTEATMLSTALSVLVFLIVASGKGQAVPANDYCFPPTPGMVDYKLYDLYADGIRLHNTISKSFQVKVPNDAHILLQQDRNDFTNNVIEIALGGWGNTKSVIRDRQQGQPKAVLQEVGIVSASEFRTFWVSWDSNTIRVGKGDTAGTNQIMSWGSLAHPVNYMSIGVGYTADGCWKIRPVEVPVTLCFAKTPLVVDYTIYDFCAKGIRIQNTNYRTFEVKVSNDAHILLQKDPTDYTNNVIEIVLGGWANTKSVIRNEQQGTPKAQNNENNIVSASGYRSFWVSWGSNTVRVGKGNTPYTQEIMNWNGLTHAINSMSVGIGYGATGGCWKFMGVP